MTAATYKKINAAIAHHGVELVKGNGYHYFADLPEAINFNADRIHSVYDGGFLRSMTLEEWVSYVDNELA